MELFVYTPLKGSFRNYCTLCTCQKQHTSVSKTMHIFKTFKMMLYVVQQAKHKNGKWNTNEFRSTWMLTTYSYSSYPSTWQPRFTGTSWVSLASFRPRRAYRTTLSLSTLFQRRQGRIKTKQEDVKFLSSKYTLLCGQFIKDLTKMYLKTMSWNV